MTFGQPGLYSHITVINSHTSSYTTVLIPLCSLYTPLKYQSSLQGLLAIISVSSTIPAAFPQN